MFKVTAVCIHTSPEPLPESKNGFVDWRLRQISPDDFKHRLKLCLVFGFGLVAPVFFQHCPPYVIIKWIQIWRVRRPFVFGDEIWTVLLQPFLRLTRDASCARLFSCVFQTFYKNLHNFWMHEYFHVKFGVHMSKYLLYKPWKFEIRILIFDRVIKNSLGDYFFFTHPVYILSINYNRIRLYS